MYSFPSFCANPATQGICENRLIRAETTSAGVTIVVTYAYDGRGNRVKKTINGMLTTRYLVDENTDYAQVLEERDGTGSLRVRDVYGHDLLSQTRDSVVSYYHPDGLGSTRTLTDTAQTVTDTYTYDAFGLLLAQTGTTDNSYLYRGEQFDHELGFYYLRARYMNPALGRFVTMDTFAGSNTDPITLHKYLYANANPITYSDPSGNFSMIGAQIVQVVRGILEKHNQLMHLASYRVAFNGVVGAVSTMIDRRLGGDEATWKEILFGAAVGAVSGGAAEVAGVALNKVPQHILTRLCKIKCLIPIFGGWGLWEEFEGIKESLREGKYAQAAYRSAQALSSLYGLKKLWNNFACFTEDTLVYTREGFKPIKDIEVGDIVYSATIEDETVTMTSGKVTDTFKRSTDTVIDLTICDAYGNEFVVSGTPEHPFFVPALHEYIPMEELVKGTVLQTDNGTEVKVVTLEIRHGEFTVYNFEVENIHSYFVSSEHGTQGVLVHNACNIARINFKELDQQEREAVLETLNHIDAGTQPTNPTMRTHWGVQFENREGYLPGRSRTASPYREYRVAPEPGNTRAGARRLVVDTITGEIFYTWTHYRPQGGASAFVQIR